MPLRKFAGVLLAGCCIAFGGCSKKSGATLIIPPAFETLPPVLTPVVTNVNASIGGYYSGLPATYATNNTRYPLLVFLHGGGQFGNGNLDLPLVLNEGIPQLLDAKSFPPDFEWNGAHFSFIVLAPQFRREPSSEEVASFITYAQAHYRIDTARLYVAGMSNGGKIACNTSADYPHLFSAVVAMSGVADSINLLNKCESIASASLPLWVFHNDSDQVIPLSGVKRFLTLMDSLKAAVPPRFTLFPSQGLLGHDSWTRATDPDYKEQNQNIYQWMLQFHK